MRARTFRWSGLLSKAGANWVVAVTSVLATGCSAPTDQRQVSQPATATTPIAVTSPVSINAEMVRLVDHAAHQLWNIEKQGMSPNSDADWENLEEHATQLAAAGALIRLEGTGVNDRDWVQRADWQKWATAVSSAGMAAFKAVEAKNVEALVAANGQLVEACEGCHKQFKPEIPSEGITHSHLH